MSVTHTPAPARSDVATATAAAEPRPFARHGAVLSIGALSWAGAMAVVGIDPVGMTDERIFSVTSGLFQIGLLCLLRVLWLTRALGEGRIARGVLRLESVLVLLAIGSTTSDGLGLTDFDKIGFVLLDACWPLSMLGMCLIGIRIAIAGRWRGASRYWPMVAESWAVVVIPVLGVFGDAVAAWVAPLHLLVGYTVLGVLVARKRG